MPESPQPEDGTFASLQQSIVPIKRDELGFVTSDQPNLSAPQVKFILAAASTSSNKDAAKLAGVDIAEVLEWFEDQEFNAIYLEFMRNKREGVKQIGSQISPLVLLELTKIVETGNNKDKLGAAKLIAQMQGMLLTQNAVVDKGLLEQIREELMRPRPVSYRDVTKGGD